MKTWSAASILMALSVELGCSSLAQAQTFKVLRQSTQFYSASALVLSGDTLYGSCSTVSGGYGAVYKMRTDGTGFVILHTFTGQDGSGPTGALLLTDATLYGTTAHGGSWGGGTVFRIDVDGTGFETLHSFSALIGSPGQATNSDGAIPLSRLVSSDGVLYGTTGNGGAAGYGTIFAISEDGSGFTNIHSFSDDLGASDLTISGTKLYGTTDRRVFSLNTDGTRFTNICSGLSGAWGPLLLCSNTLYGTTEQNGGRGMIYAIGIEGSGFTTLHNFTGSVDGSRPLGGLVLRGNTLYGTTSPVSGTGTFFAVEMDGTRFRTLYTFTVPTNGSGPGPLVRSGARFYGTALNTLFSISLSTQLAVGSSGGSLVLMWPIDPSGFSLQFTPNLDSPVWTTVSTPPTVLNGQNLMVIPPIGQQGYYRLLSE